MEVSFNKIKLAPVDARNNQPYNKTIMGARVFKLRAKQPTGNVPKGYEFQVIVQNKTGVDDADIRKALEKLGFKANSAAKSYFDIL